MPPTAPPAEEARREPTVATSVLLVDDRPENLFAMEAALEPLGVEIVRAGSAEEALRAAAARDFAVILLDVQLPGMNGYEVARQLKGRGGFGLAPIIFITALDEDRRHVHAGYASGAVDYLFKPLDPGLLRAKVQAFVRLHEQREDEVRRQQRRYADLTGAAAKLAAEQRAALILESITDAFYALDAEFRFTYVNRKAEELWRRRREDLLGRQFWTEFPNAVDTESHRRHLEVMQHRKPVAYETISPVIGRWIDVRLYPEAGGGLAAYFQDISARKQIEAEREQLVRELETQRARLANVFRHAPAFVAMMRGPQHVFELANDAYYQLVGHRELLGRPAFEALPDVRGQGFEHIIDRVYTTGEPYVGREAPIALQRTPGAPSEQRFLDFTYLPLVEADGSRSGVIAYGLDVTDHVAARQEAERARDRIAGLQALTAALGGASTPEDVADVIVSRGMAATGAATGMLVLRRPERDEELLVVRAHGFPDDVTARWARLPVNADSPAAVVTRTGDALFLDRRELVDRRFPKAGDLWDRLGTQALATVPLTLAGERLGAMSFTFTTPREFTAEECDFFFTVAAQAAVALERVRLFDALTMEREAALVARREAEEARVDAEAAASAKSEFLATMSHELRTPLNAQIGYTQLLDMGFAGPLTAEQREYLGRLNRSSAHLLDLINDVLDLSKIEAGEFTAHREDAWTGAAVDAALDLTRPLADAREVTLHEERATPEGVPYVGDEQRVRQVLVNLLSNAVKFTDAGGDIRVACGTATDAPPHASLHGHGPWAFVRVEDTGIGIPADQLARIFEPFHQVEGGHTRKQGGTGLGLAISRRLARIMGGDLTVESAIGAGSSFTLWLPAAGSSGEVHAARESAADRRARAEPASAALVAGGFDRLGSWLRASIEEILEAYVDRLRAEPGLSLARRMRRPELEDHAVSFLSDVAQSLTIVGEGGPAAAELLRDGSAIQRTISEHHGARRFAQGWSEEATRLDLAIFREEIERAVRARARSSTTAVLSDPGASDVSATIQVLVQLLDQAEAISLRAWQRAAAAAAGGGRAAAHAES